MSARDERNAAIDEMRESLLFARCLGMEIDNQGIAANSQGAGRYFARDRRERIVHGIHKNAAHEIDDKCAGAGRGLEKIGAASGRPARIVHGPNQTPLAGDEDERLALVEGMIAKRHAIRPRRENIGADRLGDPKAAGRVLAVYNNEVEPPGLPQFGQILEENRAAGAADNIADEEEAHVNKVPGS